jgi:hypothetical protein
MAFTEDLDQFFETNDFGEEAAWTGSGSRTFNCIFNSPEETIQVYDRSFYDQKFYSADVAVNQVTIECKTTDTVGFALNDVIVVRSSTYYIMFVNGNGLGTSLVHLSKHQA